MTYMMYLGLLGASCLAVSASVMAAPVENTELTFAAEQRLSFVLPDSKGGDDAIRERYLEGLEQITPELSQAHSFAIARTILGEHSPEALGIYAWPSAQAATQIRTNPQYVENYAPLVPQAWKELYTIDVDLTQPLQLTFEADKVYTLAVVWESDSAAFDQYVSLSAPVRDILGAKPLWQSEVADFQSIHSVSRPPDRLVIMQWNHPSHPDAYRTSAVIQAHQEIVGRAFERIEWYQLDHWEGY